MRQIFLTGAVRAVAQRSKGVGVKSHIARILNHRQGKLAVAPGEREVTEE